MTDLLALTLLATGTLMFVAVIGGAIWAVLNWARVAMKLDDWGW
jgi:hypothetical protein